MCNTFYIDSSGVLVPRHRREVCPLARRVMLPDPGATRIRPHYKDGIRFFPPPYPHRHQLALRLPYLSCRSDTGLPRSARLTRMGEVALCPPGALDVHDRGFSRLCTRYSAFWAQACQHLWLVAHHDVYRAFTCVNHTIHPAPSPPEARRYTVPSRFRCQSGDCGYRVRRLHTGRYLHWVGTGRVALRYVSPCPPLDPYVR